MREAVKEVQRLLVLGPAIVPALAGPGLPDPTSKSVGEFDGVVGAQQVEG